MTVRSNLPPVTNNDSALVTILYFDKYGDAQLEFPAGDVDSTVGYLQSRGFGNEAALITSVILLKQAKLDNLPVTELLDTLKGLENLELSTLVGEVLNNNRSATSTLGFKLESVVNENLRRNISA